MPFNHKLYKRVVPLCRRLERICLERWQRMEEQLRQCYSGIELRPPLVELRRMFLAAAVTGS
jgi:hypothetical protein